MTRKCIVPGCRTPSTMPSHVLPKSRSLRILWLNAINRQDLRHLDDKETRRYRVCFDHFENDAVRPTLKKRFLWENTVPSLNLPNHVIESISPEHTPSAYENSSECDIGNEVEDTNLMDVTHMDHDYIGGKSSEEQLIFEDQRQESEHTHVLENVKKELCRICGQKGQDLMLICETSLKIMADEMPLFAKIEMHLPLKMEDNDALPLHICGTCSNLLNSWHDLYVTCVAADAVLRKTFGIETTAVPVESLNNIKLSRDKDETAVPEANPDDANVEYVMDTSPLLHDVAEECGEVCEKCGRNNNGSAREEGDEFQTIFESTQSKPPCVRCRICHDSFSSIVERRNHYIMCRQLSTVCELCGVEVCHRKDLPRHKIMKHYNKASMMIKRFKCEKCVKCFNTTAQLKSHMNVHQRGSTPKHFCILCCKTFYIEQYYDMHMKKHQDGKLKRQINFQSLLKTQESGSYVCSVCQQEFEDELSLVVHLTSKKIMKCSLCHKKLVNEKCVMLHKCRQYSCRYCHKSFYGKFACDSHELIHTGEKPHKCSMCDAVFRLACLKVRHEKTFHNPILFRCTLCSKEFKRKDVYEDHLNCHMGTYLYCKFCDKKFSSRRSVAKHISRFHRTKEVLR